MEPLVWLHNYEDRNAHPFLFRRPMACPAGSRIEGVRSNAVIALLGLS